MVIFPLTIIRSFSFTSTSRVFLNAATAKGLLSKEKKVKFIDVRSPEEYGKSHIVDASNCHTIFTNLSTSDVQGVVNLKDTFQEEFRRAGICGNEHVITYEDCLSTLYGASCRGYYLLKLLGHPNVSILDGGFESWCRNGYPTTSDALVVERGTFKALWTPTAWSDKEDVKRAIEDKSAVLLDVRDIDEWKGISSSPYGKDFAPRKGRLPGAVHILWKDFMEKGESGLMSIKKPKEILEICASKGIIPDQKIIVYCFKGARASNTYVALKEAGFNDVSNYFASWNEWSRDSNLIIDSEMY